MKKSIISFLEEDERDEELEKLSKEKLIVGKPEVHKGPEDKDYLLLYYYCDEKGEEDLKSFEMLKGRTDIYEFIKNIVDSIDIHKSKVLVEGANLEEMISVYEFMKHVASFKEEGSFDIEDYNYGDIDTDI